MSAIVLTVVGAPRTKKNSQRIMVNRRSGKRFVGQSAQHDAWAESAILQLRLGMNRYRGKTFHDGQRWNMAALVYREKDTGDLLNYLAAVSDALEGAGVVENDRLIISLDGSRMLVDAKRPRVEIVLTEA